MSFCRGHWQRSSPSLRGASILKRERNHARDRYPAMQSLLRSVYRHRKTGAQPGGWDSPAAPLSALSMVSVPLVSSQDSPIDAQSQRHLQPTNGERDASRLHGGPAELKRPPETVGLQMGTRTSEIGFCLSFLFDPFQLLCLMWASLRCPWKCPIEAFHDFDVKVYWNQKSKMHRA